MSYFNNYSETRMDKAYEQDMNEKEMKYYENLFAVNPQLGENGQVILGPSFADMYNYSTLDANQEQVGNQQQSYQNLKFPHSLDNTLEDDFLLTGLYSSHVPDNNQLGSHITHKETSMGQEEYGTFLNELKEGAESIGFTKLVTSSKINSSASFEENLVCKEDDTNDMLSFNSPVEHQMVNQFGEIYPRELEYKQLSNSLQTPPCRNSQYQIYSDNSTFSLTPSEYSDQTFSPLSLWTHDSSETVTPQYSPLLAISEEMVEKRATKNSPEWCSLKTKLSCESVKKNKDTSYTTLSTKAKQMRHYSSVADISSAYQRRKQLNRHKMGQYRSVSPCLQICKRRSAKSLKTTEPCGSGVRKEGLTCFVNYTPEDSQKILTGVAPSGSNKTKARREREALEKRQKLSQAALRAVEAVGGDISGLVDDEFFVQN